MEPGTYVGQPMRQSRLAKAGASSVSKFNQTPQHQQTYTTTATTPSQKSSAVKSPPPSTTTNSTTNFTATVPSSSTSISSSSPGVQSYHNIKTTVVQTQDPNNEELDQSEFESITPHVPYVPPPQTNLWEQQQKIQLQIENQNRRNRRTPDKKEPAYDGVINGRGKGFDPDKFKRANNKVIDGVNNSENNFMSISNDSTTKSIPSSPARSPSSSNSVINPNNKTNEERTENTVHIKNNEIRVMSDSNGYNTATIAVPNQQKTDPTSPAYSHFSDNDESLMDDILGVLSLSHTSSILYPLCCYNL